MRKLFGLTFALSATLSLIIGVAFAWSNQYSLSNQGVASGSLAVTLSETEATSNKIFPTGSPIAVMSGRITNNTANPGLPVAISGGSVQVTGVTGSCATNYLSGVFSDDGNATAPVGGQSGWWTASIQMNADAPNGCQNQTISYNVTVNVDTQ